MHRSIIVIVIIALSYFAWDRFATRDDPVIPAHLEISSANTGIQVDPGETIEVTGAAAVGRNSVAVLPFIAESNGPDDDYFSAGFSEEIINALTQLPELLVTARSSAFHFKGQKLSTQDIAKRLGVGHIVEGSVLRAGGQLRIKAQLLRAEDGFQLWSEHYDRRTEDTFAMQADIAQKVATALNVVLDEEQRARMRRAGVHNVAAYTAYQKGLELYTRAHSEINQISLLRQANEYFEKSIDEAPDFTDAYLLHSDLYSHILISQANGQIDGNIREEDVQKAPAALEFDYDQAIRQARSTDQRHLAEYDRALLLGEWRGLASLSARALDTPGCQVALWAQLASTAYGQAQQLRDAYERNTKCNPVLARPWIHIVRADLWLAQPQRAIRAAESRLKTMNSPSLTAAYIMALAMAGRMEQAEQVTASSLQDDRERLISRALLAAIRGDEELASRLQDMILGRYGPNDFTSLLLEAARGRYNEANRLASLIDRRPAGYIALMQAVYLCTCGAPFDLEATPVFASMLADSGLPWPPAKPIEFPLKDW